VPVVLTESVFLAWLHLLPQLLHLNVGGVVGLGAVVVHRSLRHRWERPRLHCGCHGNCAGTGVAITLNVVVTGHFGEHFAVML